MGSATFLGIWTAMMAAMMLPSRVPLLRLDHVAALGVANGLWCAGCCAGLMAALLGLGVMSVAWMALVGAAILVEKVTPIGVAASRATSVALAAGAVLWAL